MSTAISSHPTTAPVFHLADPDMSFLQDVHPEVTDALLGFVYDPLDASANACLDDFLDPLPDQHAATDGQPRAKRPRACVVVDNDPLLDFTADAYGLAPQWGGCAAQTHVPMLPELSTEFVLPAPPPPPMQKHQQLPQVFVRGADPEKTTGNRCQSVQSAAARERRRRVSAKTAELSRLIPGGHKLNTAEMLQEAARHVKLLQAQIGMLALMPTVEAKVPSMAQEQMHAMLVCSGVQERLAGEGKCLVPSKLVHAMANDKAIKTNPQVNRELNRFMESLGK
ncbi:hypothetical protein GUJ93_ZPchr0001g31258 [Zizania palustris]|uniref:BHLH domain-containing protein n=1 Tax=Zizania palustris TaxID=103762 RepID=A0A8J5RNC8_ZIZPA|nr:hypothetical protein GUJ93_ZPchr0001g31258 [Zizania palustris]